MLQLERKARRLSHSISS